MLLDCHRHAVFTISLQYACVVPGPLEVELLGTIGGHSPAGVQRCGLTPIQSLPVLTLCAAPHLRFVLFRAPFNGREPRVTEIKSRSPPPALRFVCAFLVLFLVVCH